LQPIQAIAPDPTPLNNIKINNTLKTNNFSNFFLFFLFLPRQFLSIENRYLLHTRLPLCIDQNDEKKKLGKEILDRSLGNIHNKQ